MADRVVALSRFGTRDEALALPEDAPLGDYGVTVALRRRGEWQEVGRATYRVAEYRPPEFLVDVTADPAARIDGDTLTATVGARYLFGAPMARAAVGWSVRQDPMDPWEFELPNSEGYLFLERGWWYDEFQSRSGTSVSMVQADSLDATGHLTVRAPIVLTRPGRPARVSVNAVVTDVNRQAVLASASVVAHPAAFYIGAKPASTAYFWSAGAGQRVDLIAVRPTGARVPDAAIRGALIRREWHQVRRETDGYAQTVGEWVADTVDRCAVRTGPDGSAACRVTPTQPGTYTLHFTATDAAGRPIVTSFHRWVTGPGWVPWADETRFKMDVVPDRSRYAPGDTATVLFASPFTEAEAWVTVEREGLIEERRLTIKDGATKLAFPVTEAWAPNAFVSIVVTRGRSAQPGPLDDPGRPTIRVGYAEIRVTPERKRLAVTVAPDRPEYRPGDRATFTTTLRDQARGVPGEVTLWAVDEGVLSLTGYRTPDPIDLLYQPRGLGLRLGSNLASIVPQVAQGDKGRNPGGGGGQGAAEILRSRFRATAFFLGSVEADSTGTARATVTLPDNLTTFRVMAVAVTAGDRYGGGHSPLLVTRPLLARAALPRFVRPGDRFTAGVVVNHRAGGTPEVQVEAHTEGIALSGRRTQKTVLEAGRGREVRFDLRAAPGDSATFRFDVRGAGDRDAVRLAIPIRAELRPRVTTLAGVIDDRATVSLPVGADVDPTRSRVTLSAGSSPLALLRGYADRLRVYPYYCSEQVSSVALPLIALYHARRAAGTAQADSARLRSEVVRAVGILTRRLRDDGGIGLWSRTDWTSPWLSAHAGLVLLDARDAGFAVPDTVLAGIAGYLTSSLDREQAALLQASILVRERDVRASLGERLAVAEFLSRAGQRNQPLENDLLRRAGQLAPSDRMVLARLLAGQGGDAAARRLLEPLWAVTRVEGRTAVLPDSLASRGYFESRLRPVAELLRATLAVDPASPLVGPLFETVVEPGADRRVLVVEHSGLCRSGASGRGVARALPAGPRTGDPGHGRRSDRAGERCREPARLHDRPRPADQGEGGGLGAARARGDRRRGAGVLLSHAERGAPRTAGPARGSRVSGGALVRRPDDRPGDHRGDRGRPGPGPAPGDRAGRSIVRGDRRSPAGRARSDRSEPSNGRRAGRTGRRRLRRDGADRRPRPTDAPVGVRELGRRLVDALRPPGAPGRSGGLRGPSPLDRDLHRHVPDPGHHAGQLPLPRDPRRGDV